MKKVVYPSNRIKASTKIQATKGTIDEMLDAFENRIDELENSEAVNLSTEVTAEQCIEAADVEEYPKGYFDEYYGQTAYEEYGDLVSQECSGMVISKRRDQGQEPGGLIYEADQLGIDDPFDLLRCLEGMCYNNKAVEISDYQYKVL